MVLISQSQYSASSIISNPDTLCNVLKSNDFTGSQYSTSSIISNLSTHHLPSPLFRVKVAILYEFDYIKSSLSNSRHTLHVSQSQYSTSSIISNRLCVVPFAIHLKVAILYEFDYIKSKTSRSRSRAALLVSQYSTSSIISNQQHVFA